MGYDYKSQQKIEQPDKTASSSTISPFKNASKFGNHGMQCHEFVRRKVVRKANNVRNY